VVVAFAVAVADANCFEDIGVLTVAKYKRVVVVVVVEYY